MSKRGLAVGAFAVLVIVGSCNSRDETTTGTSVASAPVASAPAAAGATPVTAPSAAADPGVTVSKVIDGDTFEIDGGQQVRVLGIDSCEVSTYGGKQAKSSAETYLRGERVVLTREPGVDRDRAGRQLRYVATGYGSDFGETMVAADHTGVVTRKDGTSPARLAELREHDTTGRDCAEPQYAASSGGGGGDIDVDVHRHDHGLPDGLLTGGYCARKWWC